ncbi:DEAD/DEAH box helicase [Prosthecochloris sp. CIB 2401]|uniref:DEAD/DEAH box helicase n=1 Tax=Prosthecochloris sp. CIB 2401 TaxID=1868325 RepID=UPI00083AAA99|nr:DEAD/DEAH box helicase [Prosthecochloris sp. CIB 2401]
MPFRSLHIMDPILQSLHEEGYSRPTPIQEQAIPVILKGRDLLGCAQTGTGKTAAFAIPVLQLLAADRVAAKKPRIRGLVVTPTRELAIQIGESFEAYGRYTGLRTTVIFGGVNQNPQIKALNKGTDILVATPGRLLDLCGQGHISLREIELFVLDEADRMLDMGFIHDIRKLLKLLPEKKQSLFFSATMPPEIVTLAGSILHNPSKVTVTPVSSTVDTIRQQVYFVDRDNKRQLLLHLLHDNDLETVLVFTRTKHGADKVVRFLNKHDITAAAIHGNKGQGARQKALTAFKERSMRVLVATDIAARGIDVDELEYVINFDMSNIPETYVHRIGRTGRAGSRGTAISFCDAEEKAYLKDIEKLIAKSIPRVTGHPYPLTESAVAVTTSGLERPGGSGRRQGGTSASNPQQRKFRRKQAK